MQGMCWTCWGQGFSCIVRKLRVSSILVAVASHLLQTMLWSRPHDINLAPVAQVADIADVVRQQADALMLCGETAAGLFPDKCVGVLRAVATSIEEWCRCSTAHASVGVRELPTKYTEIHFQQVKVIRVDKSPRILNIQDKSGMGVLRAVATSIEEWCRCSTGHDFIPVQGLGALHARTQILKHLRRGWCCNLIKAQGSNARMVFRSSAAMAS